MGGYASCRSCSGSGNYYPKSGGRYNCKACDGKGYNTRLYEEKCAYCRTTFIHPIDKPQTHCPDCRHKQLEKGCGQSGCTNTIRYKMTQTNIPYYCRRCEGKRNTGFSASTCQGTGVWGCGNLIWSPPGKKFQYCQTCGERKKAEDAAKWREKSCAGLKGSYCGKTIKYRTDWDKAPDICPDCREKAKAEKAKREANMREKACAGQGCYNKVRYDVTWDRIPDLCADCREKAKADKARREANKREKPCSRSSCNGIVQYYADMEHPPNLCKECHNKRKALQAQYPNIREKYETTDRSYVMPGMGQTIGQMGGVKGQHYPRQGKVHCNVFEGMRGEDLHYSWDVDPVTGEVIGEVYMHHNNPRG